MRKVNKEMLKKVTDAMVAVLMEKGSMTRMVKVEEVEMFLLERGEEAFVPVTLCFKALITVSYVRYFKKDNGQLVYGFTKKALQRLEAPKSEIVQEDKELQYDELPDVVM